MKIWEEFAIAEETSKESSENEYIKQYGPRDNEMAPKVSSWGVYKGKSLFECLLY